MIRKYRNQKLQTNSWHQEEESHNYLETPGRQTKQRNQLSPIEIIAKLEWTQSNAQQNIEKLQNPTMGVTINNEWTTTESTTTVEIFEVKVKLVIWNIHCYLHHNKQFLGHIHMHISGQKYRLH